MTFIKSTVPISTHYRKANTYSCTVYRLLFFVINIDIEFCHLLFKKPKIQYRESRIIFIFTIQALNLLIYGLIKLFLKNT